MSSKHAVRSPTAIPIFAVSIAKEAMISSPPAGFAMAGLNCSHLSNLPVVDNFALREVLYAMKKPQKQHIMELVYIMLSAQYMERKANYCVMELCH